MPYCYIHANKAHCCCCCCCCCAARCKLQTQYPLLTTSKTQPNLTFRNVRYSTAQSMAPFITTITADPIYNTSIILCLESSSLYKMVVMSNSPPWGYLVRSKSPPRAQTSQSKPRGLPDPPPSWGLTSIGGLLETLPIFLCFFSMVTWRNGTPKRRNDTTTNHNPDKGTKRRSDVEAITGNDITTLEIEDY